MLEYRVDDKAKDMVRLAVGLYKYSDEVDGFFDQSLYWASIGFEYMVRRTAIGILRDINSGVELENIICDLCNSQMVKRPERETLHHQLKTLKVVRNRMFHPEGLIPDAQAIDMLKAVCGMAGYDLKRVMEEITYEQLRQLRDEVFKIPRFPREPEILDQRDICDSDFDDMEILYKKCEFLHFKELEKLLSPLHLQPEEMSELIPTTGTIWLPWVARQAGKRSHIRTIVLGANFAPNSIRIGIDFGSEAYDAKIAYYTLLLDGKLEAQLAKLVNDYYFIDTYWYFNIRNLRPVRDYFSPKIDEIRSKIGMALEETKTGSYTQAPMKGHQFLIGKIFKRGSKDFSDFLTQMPRNIKDIFCDLLNIVQHVEQSAKGSPILVKF